MQTADEERLHAEKRREDDLSGVVRDEGVLEHERLPVFHPPGTVVEDKEKVAGGNGQHRNRIAHQEPVVDDGIWK